MLYPLFPAASEARSALPDAPVVLDRAPRRRLRLPVARPLGWRRLVARLAAPVRLTGART